MRRGTHCCPDWRRALSLRIVMPMTAVLLLASTLFSQEPPEQPSPQEPGQEQPGQEAEQGVQAPVQKPGQPVSQANFSLGDSIFQDVRNSFGFSLGAYEIYVRNAYPGYAPSYSTWATSFFPSVFTNVGKNRSRLHLSYGFGYGFDNKDTSVEQTQHAATAGYTFQLNRKTVVEVSDYFFYSPDYYTSLLRPILGPIYPIGPAPPTSEAFRTPQKILRNGLRAGIDRQLGSKLSLGLFASYLIYRYETDRAYDGSGAWAGVRFGYRATKWLRVSVSYSAAVTKASAGNPGYSIQNVEIGEFEFDIGKAWKASLAGGMSITEYSYRTRMIASARADLTRTSRYNTLSFGYRRGFTYSVGMSQVYQSDIFTVGFGQWLARRLSMQLGASYWHNRSLAAGGYDALLGRAGLQFMLRPDLVASANYGYQYQRNWSSGPAEVIPMNRQLVYLGLQYVFPGISRI